MDIMTKYAALCRKADLLYASISQSFRGRMRCRIGCFRCCTLSSVLPIEAVVLAKAIRHLDSEGKAKIKGQAEQADLPHCSLLLCGRCSVYSSRPLICRTHGAPLAYIDYAAEAIEISACPVNFATEFPFDNQQLLYMDELNGELLTLNEQFTLQWGGSQLRISLRDIVLTFPALLNSTVAI